MSYIAETPNGNEIEFDTTTLSDIAEDNKELLNKLEEALNVEKKKDLEEDLEEDSFVIIDYDSGYIDERRNIIDFVETKNKKVLFTNNAKENFYETKIDIDGSVYPVILLEMGSEVSIIVNEDDVDGIITDSFEKGISKNLDDEDLEEDDFYDIEDIEDIDDVDDDNKLVF